MQIAQGFWFKKPIQQSTKMKLEKAHVPPCNVWFSTASNRTTNPNPSSEVWLTTLHELHLHWLKVNHHAKYLSQSHRWKRYRTHTHILALAVEKCQWNTSLCTWVSWCVAGLTALCTYIHAKQWLIVYSSLLIYNSMHAYTSQITHCDSISALYPSLLKTDGLERNLLRVLLQARCPTLYNVLCCQLTLLKHSKHITVTLHKYSSNILLHSKRPNAT